MYRNPRSAVINERRIQDHHDAYMYIVYRGRDVYIQAFLYSFSPPTPAR